VTGTFIDVAGQGHRPDGHNWFAPSKLNLTSSADGYPFTYVSGSNFTISFSLVNVDSGPHTFSSVTVGSPFKFDSVSPLLPYTVNKGEEIFFVISVLPPNTAGAYPLHLTITIGR
jgi:hypothetical protein